MCKNQVYYVWAFKTTTTTTTIKVEQVEQVALGNIPMFWTRTSLYVVWRMAMAEDNMVHSFGKVFLQAKEHKQD